ncbi:Uu.00g008650.m01.CDS01 [Anthostomella pinea]|uniref:Uu.00g008650.m01.CDS01 n=1 Tax=Anthostomella pinea TaxID=933095 RepID=A0AAI8VRH7_9PEZI|nr:Uu.00g008650.m01.CDS01 [Anthostomella pinea]
MKLSTALGHLALLTASLTDAAVVARPENGLLNKRANIQNPQNAGVFVYPPDGLSFTQIAAVLTIPSSVTVPDGAPAGNYYGSAWIGLDGDANGATSLVQTGIRWNLVDNVLSWQTWYEWLPQAETDISDGSITIQPGDQFTLIIHVDSPTQVTISITDTTQNEAAQTYAVTAPEGSSVSGNTAEWTVENLHPSQNLNFADFGVVTFASCSAQLSDGSYQYPPSGDDWYIVDDAGNQLNYVTVGDNTVTVQYRPSGGSVG